MNAPHEEAVEFAKQSKRENRVYVGNLSYDVKYRDLIEFMRGGGLGHLRLVFRCVRAQRRWGSIESMPGRSRTDMALKATGGVRRDCRVFGLLDDELERTVIDGFFWDDSW